MSKKKPKILEETRIWKKYKKLTKDSSYLDRKNRVLKIYEKSRDILTAVSKTFPNYTLHNEMHIVNVLNAMSGILGDAIENLSIQELEVLIIVASLHDVGMTYTDKQKKAAFSSSIQVERFLKERYPGEYELNTDNWSENMRQDYLRYLHPFRVEEIINTKEWSEIFDSWPHDMVGISTIIEVCKAHGMDLDEIKENKFLKYSKAKKTDALFCAMILRLADLLDFDDSRAPAVLFNYAKDNDISRQEFEKHTASGGFTYPEKTSEEDLPYAAVCPSPNVEHAINVFLDWIDEELQNCRYLQDQFKPKWKKKMAFPRMVSRKDIDTNDFLGGEYCLELNFDQIMKLLSGEELYSQKDVFVRELLQNSIDATLLRAKMDSSFCVEEAPIEMWEWTDSEGRWFRIDDCGTGMTLGMIKKYFLSVGSSYYTSNELKRDLSQYNFQNKTKYTGISKFGIGFLSCFLCGSFAEISTLHFDENKCRKEYKKVNKTTKYGIRLEMGQNDRFYTIRCQAEGNSCPTPLPCDKKDKYGSDYRNKCGTSVVIKLDTSKLEGIDIKESAEEIICGTRMPIFYNGERIGKTRNEIIDEYNRKKANYKEIVCLSDSEKEEFDYTFPDIKGKYPSIKKEYYYMDSEKEIGISGFTGIVETIYLCPDDNKEIIVRGVPCRFELSKSFEFGNDVDYGVVNLVITDMEKYTRFYGDRMNPVKFDSLFFGEQDENIKHTIRDFFDTCTLCPESSDLEELDLIFSNKDELEYAWRVYLNDYVFNKSWELRFDHVMDDEIIVSYKGIIQGEGELKAKNKISEGILLLDDEWRPSINVARTEIINFPIEVKLFTEFFSLDIEKSSYNFEIRKLFKNDISIDMNAWRELLNSKLGNWMIKKMKKQLQPNSELLSYLFPYQTHYGDSEIYNFIVAYCLDNYSMKVSFKDDKATIKARRNSEYDFANLPPIMFCRASDEYSNSFICYDYMNNLIGINMDHFFVKWFIENATTLRMCFNVSYSKILKAMRSQEGYAIIDEAAHLALQIDRYGDQYNICSDVPRMLNEDSILKYFNWDKYLYDTDD